MRFFLLIFFLFPFIVSAQQDTLNQVNGDGEREGFWREYYKNGKPKFIGSYENGLEEGAVLTYHPKKGRLKCECNYSKGLRSGTIKTYYKDGNLYEVGEYQNDEINGVNTFYYRNGRLGFRARFKDGEFIQALNEFGEPFKKDDALYGGTGILYGYDSYGNLMIYYYFIDRKEVSYKKFERYKESLDTQAEE